MLGLMEACNWGGNACSALPGRRMNTVGCEGCRMLDDQVCDGAVTRRRKLPSACWPARGVIAAYSCRPVIFFISDVLLSYLQKYELFAPA